MAGRPAILVFGATGHFGRRISRRLAAERDIRLIVSSRKAAHAEAVAGEIRSNVNRDDIEAVALDQASPDLVRQLRELTPTIVIHTAGPYQGQDYTVALACIEAGCNYIDLADGRAFVVGIRALDNAARSAGVSIIGGASTLPAISAAVVDSLHGRFRSIEKIETSIAPAHQTPRGIGTVRSVLSYCGAPIATWRDDRWQTVYGWQDLRWQRYPGLGRRLSAACDVPDLELFPERYAGVHSVSFHAALEASWEHISLWSMAALSRIGVVRDWTRHATRLSAISEQLIRFGSDRGGMRVRVDGTTAEGDNLSLHWLLVAERNHGPEIPCTPSILLAMRMARGESVEQGAYPCVGLLSIDEVVQGLSDHAISTAIVEER